MAWRLAQVVGLVAITACSGSSTTDSTDGGADPDIIELFPADGATDVSIAERISASIPFDQSDVCRLTMADTSLEVTTDAGVAVPGATVFFINQLRIDFTPSGMFDHDTTYHVSVTTDCAQAAESSFTTRGPDAGAPAVPVGTGFRFVDLQIAEPSDIAPLLEGFLSDGYLLAQVLGEGAETLAMLGGEGDFASSLPDPPTDPDLLVFRRDAFLFPMVGTYKAPYFQVVGSLAIPVDETQDIVLERFEISGRFVAGAGGVLQIGEANIRASSDCDDVCAVADDTLQQLCQTREVICDGAGNLNLVGTFEGAPNALADFHTITPTPADQATGVPVSTTIQLAFTREIGTGSRAAIVLLRPASDPAGASSTVEIPCFADTAPPVLSVTCTPPAPLSAATAYTALVVAHQAEEFTFTTE